MLQEHVHYYPIHVTEFKCENEELERYGRRHCVRIEGIPLVGNETSFGKLYWSRSKLKNNVNVKLDLIKSR